MKKIGDFAKFIAKNLWQQETIYVVVLAVAILFVINVLSLIPTESALSEIQTAQSASSLSAIWENPLNAPYKLSVYALTSFSPSIRMVRAVSFMFYIATCIALFYALRHWHTLQASLLTTATFATNAVVLAVSRYGYPLITLMSFFTFASLLLWQLHSKSNKLVPLIVFTALAILMYIPGAIWFVMVLAIVYWDRIKPFFKNVKRQAILSGVLIVLVSLLPLLLSFARELSLLREWMLLPPTLDLASIPRDILRVPSAFIYRMPIEPHINVGRLPIFDISSGILFLIGLNAYRQKLRLDRTRIMIGSALIGILLGALGSPIAAVIFLLPFAYSVIAAGIEYLLDEWYNVFPRNPVARSFGVLLVSFAVIFSCYYQLTRFFVVWPQTEDTRDTYTKSRIINSRD